MNWGEAGGLFYGSHWYMGYSTGTPNQNDLNNLAASIASTWNSSWLPNFSTTITLQSTFALDLSTNTGLLGVAGSGVSGTHSSPPVESGTAVHLEFKTANRYRGGHPGIYLPPGPQDEVTQPASWTGAYQTAVVGNWNSLITAMKAVTLTSFSGLSQVAVAYYKGALANTNPSPWSKKNVPKYQVPPQVHAVTAISCTPTIASQRRRRKSTGA